MEVEVKEIPGTAVIAVSLVSLLAAFLGETSHIISRRKQALVDLVDLMRPIKVINKDNRAVSWAWRLPSLADITDHQYSPISPEVRHWNSNRD